MLKTTPNFALFDPHSVKIRGQVDVISGIHLMVIHCAAAERDVLMKKKRKSSSWVKLKASSTNVRRPNISSPFGFILFYRHREDTQWHNSLKPNSG